MSKKFKLGVPLKGQFQHHWLITKPKRKKIFRRNSITQLFGENKVGYYQKFGMDGHNGIDFRTKHFGFGNAPIFATHDGTVISDASKQSDTKGRYVEIMSDPVLINGVECRVKTVYFHLSKCFVSSNLKGVKPWFKKIMIEKGARVKRGMKIGLGGNTGRFTTGCHLHLGMYIYDRTGKHILNYKNGYHGAVDPMPFFDYEGVMRYGDYRSARFYYRGEQITKEEQAILSC